MYRNIIIYIIYIHTIHIYTLYIYIYIRIYIIYIVYKVMIYFKTIFRSAKRWILAFEGGAARCINSPAGDHGDLDRPTSIISIEITH